MNHEQFLQFFREHDEWDEVAVWVRQGKHDLASAWLECKRADWMLWLAVRLGLDHKQIVRAACACARIGLKYTDDPRVAACIETTLRWCDGTASIEEVNDAASAANRAEASARYVVWAATNATWAAQDAAASAMNIDHVDDVAGWVADAAESAAGIHKPQEAAVAAQESMAAEVRRIIALDIK